eukprot:15430353-Alexandrium_andersonii.AAC.1
MGGVVARQRGRGRLAFGGELSWDAGCISGCRSFGAPQMKAPANPVRSSLPRKALVCPLGMRILDRRGG